MEPQPPVSDGTQKRSSGYPIANSLLVIVGLCVIGFALLVGQRSLIGLEAGQGGQITLLVLGAILLGLPFVRRQPGRIYQSVAVLLVNTLVALVVIELLVILSFNGQFILRGQAQLPELDYYKEQSWGKTYWDEHEQTVSNMRYRPYVLWGQPPYQGQTINVLEGGVRITPGAECDVPNAYVVFVFGGSTLWGMGAPDDGTIPAYLQTQLMAAREQPVCVWNYGEISYVSTQEVVRLTLELRDGHVPDAVIFYDGINDIVAAQQNGVPGTHRQMGIFANLFTERSLQGGLNDWLLNSYTARLIKGLARPPQDVANTEGIEVHDTALAYGIVDAYLGNYRLVEALAEAYGFDYGFFWQPVLVIGHKPMTEEESLLARVVPADLNALYAETYALIETNVPSYQHLNSLTDVFDETSHLVYFDHQHLVPEGNAIVAQTMIEHLDWLRP